MEQKIDLKQLERKVWTSFFEDGLGDIFLGCIILMLAAAPLLTRLGWGDFWSSAVFIPFWIIVYLFLVFLRKKVVIPRIGVVSFGQDRKRRLMKFNLLMLVVLSIGLILGFLSFRGSSTQGWVHSLRFIAIVLICSGLAGYFLGFMRLYVYGFLVAVSFPVGEWLYSNIGVPHHGFPVTFGITAGTIILTGVILFLRLLRKNPRLKEA